MIYYQIVPKTPISRTEEPNIKIVGCWERILSTKLVIYTDDDVAELVRDILTPPPHPVIAVIFKVPDSEWPFVKVRIDYIQVFDEDGNHLEYYFTHPVVGFKMTQSFINRVVYAPYIPLIVSPLT